MPCYSVLKRLIVFEQGTPTSQPESGPASVVTSSASARSPGSSARYKDCCDAAGPSPGMTQTFRQPSSPATDLASPLHWTAPCPARFHSLRALPFPSHGHPSLLPSARLPPPPPLSLAVSARISASSPPAVSRCSPPSPRAVTASPAPCMLLVLISSFRPPSLVLPASGRWGPGACAWCHPRDASQSVWRRPADGLFPPCPARVSECVCFTAEFNGHEVG